MYSCEEFYYKIENNKKVYYLFNNTKINPEFFVGLDLDKILEI